MLNVVAPVVTIVFQTLVSSYVPDTNSKVRKILKADVFWYEVQYSAHCIEQKWCKCVWAINRVLKRINKAGTTVATFGF